MKTGNHSLRYPCVCSQLVYTHISSEKYIVQDVQSRRYFTLNHMTVRIMQRLDGTRAPEFVSAELGIPFTIVCYVVDQLTRLRLLTLEEPLSQAQVHKNATLQTMRRWGHRLILIRKDIITTDGWMDRVYRYLALKYIFQPWLGIVLLALYTGAYVVYVRYTSDLQMAFSRLFTQPQNFPIYVLLGLTLSFCTSILHELAHGFACKHFGGCVRALGIGLYYLQPVFYCDVSDAWLFPKRRQRLLTHAAGVLMNLFL